MTGLENIINRIQQDSTARSDEILADAQKKCEQILAQAEQSSRNAAAKIAGDAEKECAVILSMARSGAEQIEKRAVLEAKVAVLNETLEGLLTELLHLPEDRYFAVLLKLAQENAMSGTCTAKLSARDLGRLPSDFEQKLRNVLSEKGAVCTLSREAADIEGGLVLLYGDIEVNCSFRAIIDANADFYKAEISKIIF